ncbi:MAG: hypothetical protein LAP21_18760 [Acidobacteriia bacterium]|nr:hypothetical protein [Terriglobia bacterium]
MTRHIDPPQSGVVLEKPEIVAARKIADHLGLEHYQNNEDLSAIIAVAYDDREHALGELVQAVTSLIPVCPLADRHPAADCRYCRIIVAIDKLRRTTA